MVSVAAVTPPLFPSSVDVVLPCLDEARALPWVLGRVPAGWRAIVVDNGSRDGSARIAAELGATVVTEPRRGFGAACHAGLLAADAELVCFLDCDGSLDPAQLPRVADPVLAGTADLVLGRRRPTSFGAWPPHARLANLVLARRLRALTGADLHDLGPMRAARRERLLALGLGDRRSGYPLEAVLSAAAAGMRIAEVPVDYRPRAGRSKVTGTVRGTRQAVRDMRAVLAAPPPTLLVLAKSPVPGRVKTRLTPAFTPEQAADLAEAALADTLAALALVPAGRRLLVLDGEPGRWLPPGWEVLPQDGGGLDRRLAAAFAHAARLAPHAPALLVGMDTPQLDPAALAAPLAAAERPGADAWFGPAEDGGFWALGLARPDARLAERLLHGVPMSTADTGRHVLDRLAADGLTVRELPTLLDVDHPEDAARAAALAPGTRFAARLREFAAAPGAAR
ncbi:glycosyltransferase A (GT-A) superfamily protein (DUF2064 family) [Kitasatospora cineracea]|uniref:Glycosyltransferase A (GT-A) superfamily protein (DUF2064 family) n=2 Tax=Kitasatospora cineracea TaxID=88074 RepID=A0A3N4R3H9_9ACTN|nr:glycosyltransferase A (GT-A) superfamily protein (DUF2064 family) [Kitasatospora cineracea]